MSPRAEAAPDQGRGNLCRRADFADRAGSENRAGRNADESVDGIPSGIDSGNLVGEEFDEIHETRGGHHQRVRDNPEIGR